ncbi:alkaline phosphatase [Striga asiatica]|uniref:Alkaline phosphatase n=1 Tax=Striga asiatica TaxID=4170 RepID=A0A5A7PLR3_STRAF|nr:alkaline phosphatase [Striga asiatica]
MVSSNSELEFSKDKNGGSKEIGPSPSEPMELDDSKIHDLDLSNLVNVPVRQFEQKVYVPKSQRSFVKITRSKLVESKNKTSDKQVGFYEPQGNKTLLKRKTIPDNELSELDYIDFSLRKIKTNHG